MKHFKIVIASILLMIGTQLGAQKYGYVNTDALIASLPEVEIANKNIEALRDSLTQALSEKVIALQKKYANLEARVNEIPPVQLEKEKVALQAEEQEIQKMDNEGQTKLYLRTQEMLNPIQEKVRLAIQKLADKEGYTYIFDTSGGFVLYADEALDLTEQVKSNL